MSGQTMVISYDCNTFGMVGMVSDSCCVLVQVLLRPRCVVRNSWWLSCTRDWQQGQWQVRQPLLSSLSSCHDLYCAIGLLLGGPTVLPVQLGPC
jgi:hypothetical protein